MLHVVRQFLLFAIPILVCLNANPAKSGVFGPDDRTPTEFKAWPLSAVGKVERRKMAANRKSADADPLIETAVCTGTLVARDLVLTGAHCLIDRDGASVALSDLRFILERGALKNAARNSSRSASVVRVEMGTIEPSKVRADDWALLQLDRPLGDSAGWIEVNAKESFAKWPQEVDLPGFALDFEKAKRPFIHGSCHIQMFESLYGYLKHDCDMNPGSSGAPLLVKNGQNVAIVGVNVAHTDPAPFSYSPVFTRRNANVAVTASRFASTLVAMRDHPTQKGRFYVTTVPYRQPSVLPATPDSGAPARAIVAR